MLNLSTKDTYRTNDGLLWELYQSTEDPNVFYIAPIPQLARDAQTGKYSFALVQYAGEPAGGYCTLETQLDVPDQDMAEIRTYLTKTYNTLAPQPQVLTGRFRLLAFLTYTSPDGRISQSVSALPTPFENNRAVFLLNLDADAMALWKRYFGGDTSAGLFNIRYEFQAAGRLPALTVVSNFNAAVAYEYEKIHTVVYDQKR